MKLRNGLIAIAASLFFVTFTFAGPVPYPDIGSGGSTKVDAKSVKESDSSSSSSADSGSNKGVTSNKQTGNTSSSISGSVKMEGKNSLRNPLPLGK